METKKWGRHYAGACLLLPLVILHAIRPTAAQMASDNYKIRTSALTNGGGRKSSTNYGMWNSFGQPTPSGFSQSPSYGLYAGFQATTIEEYVLPTAQRGDVNGDMSINVLDVLATINHILGTVPLTGDALVRADCNGDIEINVLDALGIVNVILGTGTCPP